jgi:hypothetical protein
LKRSRASWLAVSTVSGNARIAKTDVALRGVRHRCSAAQATGESDDRVVGNLPSIALLELAPGGKRPAYKRAQPAQAEPGRYLGAAASNCPNPRSQTPKQSDWPGIHAKRLLRRRLQKDCQP